MLGCSGIRNVCIVFLLTCAPRPPFSLSSLLLSSLLGGWPGFSFSSSASLLRQASSPQDGAGCALCLSPLLLCLVSSARVGRHPLVFCSSFFSFLFFSFLFFSFLFFSFLFFSFLFFSFLFFSFLFFSFLFFSFLFFLSFFLLLFLALHLQRSLLEGSCANQSL